MVVIAECHDCIVHSLQSDVSAGRGRRGAEDQVVASTGWAVWLPTFRLVDLLACRLVGFSTCWEVGKLESWKVGGARWCEHKSRKTGEGQPCKRERTQDRAYQKKRGWAHPPPSFPRERGEEERRVHPPIVTEQDAEKSKE